MKKFLVFIFLVSVMIFPMNVQAAQFGKDVTIRAVFVRMDTSKLPLDGPAIYYFKTSNGRLIQIHIPARGECSGEFEAGIKPGDQVVIFGKPENGYLDICGAKEYHILKVKP